jgi:hypothetical protein
LVERSIEPLVGRTFDQGERAREIWTSAGEKTHRVGVTA